MRGPTHLGLRPTDAAGSPDAHGVLSVTTAQIEKKLILMGYSPAEAVRIAPLVERVVADHPYMTLEYMLWLLQKKVRITATEAMSAMERL